MQSDRKSETADKTVSDSSVAQRHAIGEEVALNPTASDSEEMRDVSSEEDGPRNEEDMNENQEIENDSDDEELGSSDGETSVSSSSEEGSIQDMFNMHGIQESDDEDNDSHEVIPVSLPEELAELAAGREGDGDDDDVVQAILRAREKHREHPPSIEVEDGIASMSFHPQQQIIAIGTFTGDVAVYKYSNEDCELANTFELHMKAIRDIEFCKDGKSLISTSKDKSINRTDMETGKLINLWEKAHVSPVHTLYILDENRFCSGCEEGFVNLWDMRQKNAIFSLQVMEDVVTSIVSTPQNRHLAVACGGTITAINVNAKKIFVQSEEYEHDFTCLGLFRHDTKLLAGTSKGTMYVFNWGEFGLHCEEFTGFKQPVSCMLPVTETVAVTGWEDGKIRATHLFPHQRLGVVGQHDCSVDCMDISNDGTIIASAAAASEHVKFWNIKYIEEVQVTCTKQKKKKNEHNLPSSAVRNASDFFADMAGPS